MKKHKGVGKSWGSCQDTMYISPGVKVRVKEDGMKAS